MNKLFDHYSSVMPLLKSIDKYHDLVLLPSFLLLLVIFLTHV